VNGNGGKKHANRYFLLIMLGLAFLAFLFVIRIFVVQIVVAAVFATLFYPFYQWLLARLHHRGWTALACCFALFLGLLLPVAVIADLFARQAIELYQIVEPQVRQFLQGGTPPFLEQIRSFRLFAWLEQSREYWQEPLSEGLRFAGGFAAQVINRTSRATLGLVIDTFIIFFTLFYFFRDGERIVERLKYVIPLDETSKEKIVERFGAISRATIRVTLIIGLIQGALGALLLLAFGVRTWVLWGVIMAVFAIIPVLGAWSVLVPFGIFEMASGHIWQGITIILVSTVVISTIDNLLRPRLVGRGAKMHDLLIFFSTLGGLAVFGFMGFIIGPLIAAIFVTLLDIYAFEFREQLQAGNNVV
jgi:predicted PurR-regulated permease PerM